MATRVLRWLAARPRSGCCWCWCIGRRDDQHGLRRRVRTLVAAVPRPVRPRVHACDSDRIQPSRRQRHRRRVGPGADDLDAAALAPRPAGTGARTIDARHAGAAGRPRRRRRDVATVSRRPGLALRHLAGRLCFHISERSARVRVHAQPRRGPCTAGGAAHCAGACWASARTYWWSSISARMSATPTSAWRAPIGRCATASSFHRWMAPPAWSSRIGWPHWARSCCSAGWPSALERSPSWVRWR